MQANDERISKVIVLLTEALKEADVIEASLLGAKIDDALHSAKDLLIKDSRIH